MRIGFFSDRYLPMTDGIAISIESFREELERRGHQVFIFAPKPSLRYKETTKNVYRFPALKGLFFEDYFTSFFFPPQEVRRLEKLNLDIIHFHTPASIGLFGAYFAIRHQVPLVTTYHTDLFEYVKHYPAVLPGTIALSMLAPVITGGGMSEYRSSLSSITPERSVDKWNQKIVERGVTMVHNHCDLVIAPSRKIERQLKSWKTTSRIAILPTGVDKITTTSREISLSRKRFGLEPDDEVVLFVGRVGTEKNLGLLIKSFDAVAKARPKAKLVIVGRGDDLEHFYDQSQLSPFRDRIVFTGRIDRSRLGAMFAVASVFAFPSLADTQALVLNEAARAGVPIVMIDRDITEVVRQGENGLLAKNNPKDFAAKIIDVLKDERRRQTMGLAGVTLAAEFGVSQQTEKLLRLYEETIEHYHETFLDRAGR